MEILYRGTPPEQRQYDARCLNCNTLVRFTRSEAKYFTSARNEAWLEVKCPVCDHAIAKDI